MRHAVLAPIVRLAGLTIYCALFVLMLKSSAIAQVLNQLPSGTEASLAVNSSAQPSCDLQLPENRPWMKSEVAAWNTICATGVASVNFSSSDLEPKPCKPMEIEGPIPTNRIVSAKFIELLTTNVEYQEKFSRPQVVLRCAQIVGTLDLQFFEIPVTLNIWESQFLGDIDLKGAQILGNFGLDGSRVDGRIDADGVSIFGNLFLRFDGEFGREVDLIGGMISGDVVLDGSHFSRSVNMVRLRVGQSLSLVGTTLDEDFDVRDALIGGPLDADRSSFSGDFRAEGAQVSGSFFLRDSPNLAGALRAQGATIGGNLELSRSIFSGPVNANIIGVGQHLVMLNSKFHGPVNMLNSSVSGSVYGNEANFDSILDASQIEVRGDVQLRDVQRFGALVDFRGAHIGGNFAAEGSTFDSWLSCDSMHVGGNIFLHGGALFKDQVRLRGANILGQVVVSGSTFEGRLNAGSVTVGGDFIVRKNATFEEGIDLSSSSIGIDLQLGSSSLDGYINLSGATFGGDLILSSRSELHGRPNWGPNAFLDLGNLEVRSLQAELDAWRRDDSILVTADLNGFQYKALGGRFANHNTDGSNMRNLHPHALVKWIREIQFNHDSDYIPQPYEQLASVLRSSGRVEAARSIQYAKAEQRRNAVSTPRLTKIRLWLLSTLVGHGVYPFRALYWFLAIVILGFAVSFRSKSERLTTWWSKLWFSLENSLPLVDLDESLKSLEHSDAIATNFFHTQKIVGFILASILVGALTLLGS